MNLNEVAQERELIMREYSNAIEQARQNNEYVCEKLHTDMLKKLNHSIPTYFCICTREASIYSKC